MGVTMRMAAVLLLAVPAWAQMDFSGSWQAIYQEDQPERIPGPALVDYLGIPINDAARQWALSWDPSRLSLNEHQCQVHTAAYIHRGPLMMRMWEEKDPVTQALVAIKLYISTYEQTRTFWMDGRPHPPEYEKHTWMGFSTGKFDGDTLTVTTTHIKQGWHRRNGIPSSDRITLTDHFIRHGDHLTHVSVVTDPDYLTEPLVKSDDYLYIARPGGNWLWPCEYVVEVAGRKRDVVPSYAPGENPFVREFADKHNLATETVLGGSETMYPEYQQKLRAK